jgi:hypothetical protein
MADSGPGPAGTAASGDLEELSRDSWIDAFKRTAKAFKADKLTDTRPPVQGPGRAARALEAAGPEPGRSPTSPSRSEARSPPDGAR